MSDNKKLLAEYASSKQSYIDDESILIQAEELYGKVYSICQIAIEYCMYINYNINSDSLRDIMAGYESPDLDKVLDFSDNVSDFKKIENKLEFLKNIIKKRMYEIDEKKGECSKQILFYKNQLNNVERSIREIEGKVYKAANREVLK